MYRQVGLDDQSVANPLRHSVLVKSNSECTALGVSISDLWNHQGVANPLSQSVPVNVTASLQY